MKTTIKNLLICALNTRPISTIGRRIFGHGIPIFMIHRMQQNNSTSNATSTAHLRRCLQYLVDKGCTFISLYDLIIALKNNQTLPDKSVVFTMDDGFEDQIRLAAPIFLEFDCPITIFLITGMLDNKLWPWDDKVAYIINSAKTNTISIPIGDEHYQLSLKTVHERNLARKTIRNAMKATSANEIEVILKQLEIATNSDIPESPPDEFKPATWNLAREYENKSVHFAPHTISHRVLSKLDTATMETEILGSWQRLQDELVSPKPIFCYPTGRYSDFGAREIQLLQKSGFIGAVSTIPAQVRPERTNNYYINALPRYALPNSFPDFLKYCTWFEYARERNQRFWPR